MIGDREFRVETVEGEADTYMVYWGDEEYKWEPLPYMQDCYVKEGPLFYDRWIKPGLKYPYDKSLEERVTWDAEKIFRESIYAGNWFAAREGVHAADYANVLVDPKGRERVKTLAEYARGYFQPEAIKLLPSELQGVLGRKYMFIMHSPDDVSGVSGLNFSYMNDKPTDVWFYTPSVRKVRRLSEGSRQDFMPGSNYRQEDFVITQPIHKYKLTGTELFRPPLDYIGYPNSKQKHWSDNECKRFHGEGQPCWVIEETPFKTPWWFYKQIRWINMKDLTQCLGEAYDEKGRKIRYITGGYFLPDPVNRPLIYNWVTWNVNDLTTGFKTYGPLNYGEQWKKVYGDGRVYLDSGMPEKYFSPSTLLKEYTSKVLFWK